MTSAPHQPRIILRSAVLPAGYSDGYLRRALRSGAIVAVLPGAYLSSGDLPDLGLLEWHLATATAAIGRLGGDPVISHLSAAVLHGLQPASSAQLPVHVTRRPPAKSRRSERIVAHRAELTTEDVGAIAGLPVTTAARTALDCAFLLPSPAAMALITAGFAAEQFTPEALLRQLARYQRVPGIRRVGEIVRDAGGPDGCDQSPTVSNTVAGLAIGSADSQS